MSRSPAPLYLVVLLAVSACAQSVPGDGRPDVPALEPKGPPLVAFGIEAALADFGQRLGAPRRTSTPSGAFSVEEGEPMIGRGRLALGIVCPECISGGGPAAGRRTSICDLRTIALSLHGH